MAWRTWAAALALVCVLRHAACLETSTALGTQNDYVATPQGVSYEKSLYMALLGYLVFGVIGDLAVTVREAKWKTIARVLPTYEMWRQSIPPGNPRRFQICKDWMAKEDYKQLASNPDLPDAEEDAQLRSCFVTMLQNINDDPLAPDGYRAMVGIRNIMPVLAFVCKLAAGFFALNLAMEVIGSRQTVSKERDLYEQSELMLFLNPVLPTDQYYVATMKLQGFPSLASLYSRTMQDVSPLRRAVATTCALQLEKVWIFPAHQDVMHFDSSEAPDKTLDVLAVMTFDECVGDDPISSECKDKQDMCATALSELNVLIERINLEFRLGHTTETWSGAGASNVPVPVKSVVSVTTESIEVTNNLRDAANRGNFVCGPLGSLIGLHASAYDHVDLDAPCASGVHYGAACELRCREGCGRYMPGDRWGRTIVCGFDDDATGDGGLKWLPAGAAYQEMCAPDPIHRTPGAAIHLTGQVPLWNHSLAIAGTRPALTGWRNTIGSAVTHATCQTPCADMYSEAPSGGTRITTYRGSTGRRQMSWSGVTPPLLVGGKTMIADLWGADPSYRYYDTGRPATCGRFTMQSSAQDPPTEAEHLTAALERGVTVVVLGNVSEPYELNNLQSVLSPMHMINLPPTVKAAIDSNGSGTVAGRAALRTGWQSTLDEGYVQDGHMLISLRANCTEVPSPRMSKHGCACKRECKMHYTPPHAANGLPTLMRPTGEKVVLASSRFNGDRPAYDYCFVRPGCEWQLGRADVDSPSDDLLLKEGAAMPQYHWDWCTVSSTPPATTVRSSVSVRINGVEVATAAGLTTVAATTAAARGATAVSSCARFAEAIKFGAASGSASSYDTGRSSSASSNITRLLAGMYQSPSYIGAGCGSSFGAADGTEASACFEEPLTGDVGEFALFTRYVPLRQLEAIEFFVASKWGMKTRLGPAEPPAVQAHAIACDETVAGHKFSCRIRFPPQGTRFYEARMHRLRACYCVDASPASQPPMSRDGCVAAGVCEDVTAGFGTHSFDSISFGSSTTEALRFLLQAQTGRALEGDDRRMWSNDRPPWQQCTTPEGVGCWLTGPPSVPMYAANFTNATADGGPGV